MTILPVTLMTQQPTHAQGTLLLQFLNYYLTQRNSLTGLKKNHLKANPEKYHLLLSSKSSIETKIGGVSVKSRKMETLLGVSINSELNCENHISNICSKVSRKLSALGCIAGGIKRRIKNIRELSWMLDSISFCSFL